MLFRTSAIMIAVALNSLFCFGQEKNNVDVFIGKAADTAILSASPDQIVFCFAGVCLLKEKSKSKTTLILVQDKIVTSEIKTCRIEYTTGLNERWTFSYFETVLFVDEKTKIDHIVKLIEKNLGKKTEKTTEKQRTLFNWDFEKRYYLLLEETSKNKDEIRLEIARNNGYD